MIPALHAELFSPAVWCVVCATILAKSYKLTAGFPGMAVPMMGTVHTNPTTGDRMEGMSEAPWWVRVGIREGISTVFAFGLLWFVLGNVAEVMKHLSADNVKVLQNQELILMHEGEIMKQIQDHSAAVLALNRYVICLSQAGTGQDRQRCAIEAMPR